MADRNIVVTEKRKKKLETAFSNRDKRLKQIQEIAQTVAFYVNNLSSVFDTTKQMNAFYEALKKEVNRLMKVYKQRTPINLVSSRGVHSDELEFNWTIRFYCRNSGELLEKLALVATKKTLETALSNREKKLKQIQEIAQTVAFYSTKYTRIYPTVKQTIEFKNEINNLMKVYKQRKLIDLVSSRGIHSKELEFNWSIRFYCRNSGELLEKLALVEEDSLSNVA